MATIFNKFEAAIVNGQPIGLQKHNLAVVAKRLGCKQDIISYVDQFGRDHAPHEPGIYWHNEDERQEMIQACDIASKAHQRGLVIPVPDHLAPDVLCFGCRNLCPLQRLVNKARERFYYSEALQRMKEKK